MVFLIEGIGISDLFNVARALILIIILFFIFYFGRVDLDLQHFHGSSVWDAEA